MYGDITVEITEELERKLEALENTRIGPARFPWTPALDAALLKYWPVKRHMDVAKTLGCSDVVALRRYRELTEKSDGQS